VPPLPPIRPGGSSLDRRFRDALRVGLEPVVPPDDDLPGLSDAARLEADLRRLATILRNVQHLGRSCGRELGGRLTGPELAAVLALADWVVGPIGPPDAAALADTRPGRAEELIRREALRAGLSEVELRLALLCHSWYGGRRPFVYAVQRATALCFGMSLDGFRDDGRLPADQRPAVRALVRAVHASTQAWLSTRGIERATLWRAEQASQPPGLAPVHPVRSPLASWSTRFDVLHAWCSGDTWPLETNGPRRRLLLADVPAARIISTPWTGFASADELAHEVLVLAGDGYCWGLAWDGTTPPVADEDDYLARLPVHRAGVTLPA
jgi:hypothetical protein